MLPTANFTDRITGNINVEARGNDLLAVCFNAMASPCEVLLCEIERSAALRLGAMIAKEAWRIEAKFSRYRDDSVLAWIHRTRGTLIEVDNETASLLDFAQHCFEISDGLFDITSGVLRRVWRFDCSDRIPEQADIIDLLPLIGFGKLKWDSPNLCIPKGMELDLGGIGKEYAVDRAYDQLASEYSGPFLINFGGDLRANRPPQQGPWKVGVERPDTDRQAAMLLDLAQGALATSGDAHRYLHRAQIRFGHVLDPRTGWPVVGAPRSVTVAASSCTEAGFLATLALLKGPGAERFLIDSEVRHWISR
jgi:FAD:protein FMN transferase